MQVESNLLSNNKQKPFYSLLSKPTCYFDNEKQVYLPLTNLNLSIMEIETGKFTTFPSVLHQKRINCIKQKNNILITASNDFSIKLWDKISGKMISKFSKPGAEFNVLDLSEHILSAAATSKLFFWDLRKMKQRGQFKDSFNGEITSIQFDQNTPTILMGCSVDGMINKFDLKQANEEQAFQWCTKILQSPSKLQFINNVTLVSTTNHTLYLLKQQDVKKKIAVNNLQEPKHILHSRLIYENNQYNFEYFSWNLEDQLIEKFRNEDLIGHVSNVVDSQIFLPLGQDKIIYIDENGDVFIKKILPGEHIVEEFSTYTPPNLNFDFKNSQNIHQKLQKIEQQEPENKNGFILNKSQTFKNKTKKFKPY